MHWTLRTALVAVSITGSSASCSAPNSDPAVETAQEAYCAGLYVTHVATRPGSVFYVSPETLATATDGWGPQALTLSVAQSFSPQISYQINPSLTKTKDKLTKTIQKGVGFSVTTTVSLTATSVVLVPINGYYRIEAYPEYQIVDWEMHADACNFLPDTFVTRGSVYRPVGIHFRALMYVDSEWTPIEPPSAAELQQPPPWSNESDAGAPGYAGSTGSAGLPGVGLGAGTGPGSPRGG